MVSRHQHIAWTMWIVSRLFTEYECPQTKTHALRSTDEGTSPPREAVNLAGIGFAYETLTEAGTSQCLPLLRCDRYYRTGASRMSNAFARARHSGEGKCRACGKLEAWPNCSNLAEHTRVAAFRIGRTCVCTSRPQPRSDDRSNHTGGRLRLLQGFLVSY